MTNYIKMMRDEINSISAHMSDKELFSSKAFIGYLKNILKTALGKYQDRSTELIVACDKSNGSDGFTAGDTIYINCEGPLASGVSTRIDKFYIILGILIHEAGHRLFTDFPALKSFIEKWNLTIHSESNPPFPVEDPRFDQMVNELRELPNLANYWQGVIRNLQNIVEDGYIEQRLILIFSGINVMALRKLNRHLFTLHPTIAESFEEIIQQEDKDEKDMMFVAFLMNQMLRYVKEFPEKKGSWDTSSEKDLLYRQYDQFMEAVSPLLDDLMYQRDSQVRYAEINEIMLELYDYFPGRMEMESEEKEESDEKKDSGDMNPSSASRKDIAPGKGGEELPLIGSTSMPEGETTPIQDGAEEEKIAEKKERIKELSDSEEVGIRKYDTAMKEVISHIAESKVEDAHCKELRKEGEEIEKVILAGVDNPPEEWTYKIHREKTESIEEWEREEYYRIMSELRLISESAKRRLNFGSKKRESIVSSKRFLIGRFDPMQYPRAELSGDGRTFKQSTPPISKPSVAFAILIDESGSMESGHPVYKYETARKSAILLNDILTDAKIPHLIVGHTDNDGTCDILMYHDFNEVDHRDKFRLAKISARNGNRDGAAITYCCEKLLKRPEADKILIVISDGMPTESGFYSRNATEDTEITIAKYRKKRCRVIGAIIDSYGTVENIYGKQNCLDMTDLTEVPFTLADLVKRYVLNKI